MKLVCVREEDAVDMRLSQMIHRCKREVYFKGKIRDVHHCPIYGNEKLACEARVVLFLCGLCERHITHPPCLSISSPLYPLVYKAVLAARACWYL